MTELKKKDFYDSYNDLTIEVKINKLTLKYF